MSNDYNINLSEVELGAVLLGLGELPAKTSYDLINKIRNVVTDKNAVEEVTSEVKQLLTE